MKAKGVKGAIIKASEGTTWRDDQFKRNVAECHRVGIAWGAYHYFYPTLPAPQQAANFIDAMMGYAPDLGIWGDFEQPATGIDVQTLAHSFMDEIKKYYSAGIYTSPGYANYTLKNATWMKEFPLWIAHYGVTKPTIPAPWTEAVLWQYTSKGQGYGSQGDCYTDVNQFMRADSEWEAFSGVSSDPVVIPPPQPSTVVFTAEDKARLDRMWLQFVADHPTSAKAV
jgi:lysozyme